MTSIEEMEDYLYNMGVDVSDFDFETVDGVIVDPGDGNLHVGLRRGMSRKKRKETIVHEAGHAVYGGLCTISAPARIRQKSEVVARRWAENKIASPDEIARAVASGIDTVWDLAEYFDITCEGMSNIIDSYRARGKLDQDFSFV